jgi:hypothetical protein
LLTTIVISRGDMMMLGEAYAFGVVWSFAMKALSVLVLRYKQPGAREWKVPLNFHIGKTEIPLGLMMITVALFAPVAQHPARQRPGGGEESPPPAPSGPHPRQNRYPQNGYRGALGPPRDAGGLGRTRTRKQPALLRIPRASGRKISSWRIVSGWP